MATTARSAAFTTAAAHTVASDGPTGFLRRLGAIPAMLRDGLTGRFPGLTRGKLMLMTLAALYIVSPIDLLPEALLTIPGLADDAVIGAWLAAALFTSTDDYLLWRGQVSDRVVPGQVIR
jgi:uncharacterized membrane protein YkvA (DUF1232 family)